MTDLPPTHPAWLEYDSAADWCAAHSLKGKHGDPLPALISTDVLGLINYDPDAFERRVREFAYGRAMESREPKGCRLCGDRPSADIAQCGADFCPSKS